MSGLTLNTDGQFRYICQWFNEWSELQRDDFVPILVDCLKNSPSIYMNGVVNDLSNSGCTDKPMSLFQCRVSMPSDKIYILIDDFITIAQAFPK